MSRCPETGDFKQVFSHKFYMYFLFSCPSCMLGLDNIPVLVLFVSTAVNGTEVDQRRSSWPRQWVVQLQQQQQGAVEGCKAAHTTSASRGRWGPCVQGPQTER